MKEVPAPLVMMVSQRHPADCGAATLAMYLHVSYEDALLALGDVRILTSGVWFTELIRAAAKLGVTLKKRTRYDLETDEGMLQIVPKRGPQHVLLLRAGLIFDTDCSVWEPESYLTSSKARFGALLSSDGA